MWEELRNRVGAGLAQLGDSLAANENVFQALHHLVDSVVPVATFIVAVVAYRRFREHWPRVKIRQSVTRVILDERRALVRVSLNFENVGKVRAVISRGFIRVQQILPLPLDESWVEAHDNVISWPRIGRWPDDTDAGAIKAPPSAKVGSSASIFMADPHIDMEPGESQEFARDFIVDREVEAIKVYGGFSHKKANRGRVRAIKRALGFHRDKDILYRGWTISSIERFGTRMGQEGDVQDHGRGVDVPSSLHGGAQLGHRPTARHGDAAENPT